MLMQCYRTHYMNENTEPAELPVAPISSETKSILHVFIDKAVNTVALKGFNKEFYIIDYHVTFSIM